MNFHPFPGRILGKLQNKNLKKHVKEFLMFLKKICLVTEIIEN